MVAQNSSLFPDSESGDSLRTSDLPLINVIDSIFLPIVPFVVYPFAWTGHIVFEKNEPAAWSNPLWAKACDWIMLKDVLTGKLK